MPHLDPIKYRDLIYHLRRLDFEGPYPGRNPQYMVRVEDKATLMIPNPHRHYIGEAMLIRLLKPAAIDKATWEKL